jgi:hypothetical protein
VTRPPFPANFREFQAWFPDDAACLRYLARSRWPDGFACPHCGNAGGWEITARVKSRAKDATEQTPRRVRTLWECSACARQTSATSGTILDHTRLPLMVWFHAAFLMATDKRGISAILLDSQLDLGNHKTAWFLLHKLRRAMVNAGRTRITGVVEMDGTYVGGYQPGLKGGRQRKGRKAAMVLVAVEVRTRTWTDKEGKTHTREYGGRVRAEVVRAETAEWIADFLTRNVEPGSLIRSDALPGYASATRELGYRHERRVQGRIRDTGQVVIIAHRVISNVKAWLVGTHHGVGRPHLQAYLDEFVFRFNRRQSPEAAFQTLLGLGSRHAPVRRGTLIGATDLPSYYEGDEIHDGEPEEQETD